MKEETSKVSLSGSIEVHQADKRGKGDLPGTGTCMDRGKEEGKGR